MKKPETMNIKRSSMNTNIANVANVESNSTSIFRSTSVSISIMAILVLSYLDLSQSFTIVPTRIQPPHSILIGRQQQRQQRQQQQRGGGKGVLVRPLHIASLPRTDTGTDTRTRAGTQRKPSSIDNELHRAFTPSSASSSAASSAASSTSTSHSSPLINEIHSILDDGHGHINKDLAQSIWRWENENLHPVDSNPFPFASKLGDYSTRDGLRLVESVATSEMELAQQSNFGVIAGADVDVDGGLYNDLVQEGVVSLMKCMVVWDNGNSRDNDNSSDNDSEKDQGQGQGQGNDFESFAAREISTSMKKLLGGGPRSAVNAGGIDVGVGKKKVTTAAVAVVNDNDDTVQETNESSSVDQIMNPLTKAVLDENPTPDEIALSEMIRHDICDFLERTLNTNELKVIRMRFGLDLDLEEMKDRDIPVKKNVGTSSSLEEIALTLSTSVGDVQNIELAALAKLRTSFSNDYIGAYLDNDDHTEEVSL